MQDRDSKTLIKELQSVDVKLPLHQTMLRKRLLDAHAEQTSLRRRLLAKSGMHTSSGRQTQGFRGFVPAVGMIAALIGLAMVGAIWFLSSDRPGSGQKLIVSTTTGTSVTGSSRAASNTGGGGCTSSACSVSASNQEGKKSDVQTAAASEPSAQASPAAQQKAGGTVNSTSQQGTLAVLGNAVINPQSNQPAASPSSSPPVSQPAQQPPAQNSPQRPIVAITIPVSVGADIIRPGNSGKAAKDKPTKAEKALAKTLKHAEL